MEVLQGNQPDPGQSRRRQDQSAAEDRSLDWTERPSDVLLHPHSPLALADVLSQAHGIFDLLPLTDDTTTQDESTEIAANSPVVSLQQRRRRRDPRSHANLLTKHEPEELFERCRHLLVDVALVKQRGMKRIYLAAGFLRWPDAENASRPMRSPLLLYPAILARKEDNTEGSTQAGIRYEIRLEGSGPDVNTALKKRCKELFDIELPVFERTRNLQEYFALVVEHITAADDMQLEFDVALGSSANPQSLADAATSSIRLPKLPPNFDTSLAMTITGNKSLRELHAVLNLIRDYGNNEKLPALSQAANETGPSISRIREYSKKLAAHGLDQVEFQRLPGLPDKITQWIESAQNSLSGELINTVLQQPTISARHFIRLAGVIELIDKAPLALEQYRHPDLCFGATPTLLRRAHHQAKIIEDELAALQEYFVMDKVPAKQQLLNLVEELGGTIADEPDVVEADYFNARRQFMEFSIEKPTTLTQEHRRLLSQLAKVLRFRELFVNNTEYRLALGPGYKGLRTDWSSLETMTDYAREFSEFLESETIAAQVLTHWEKFRTTFILELDKLQVSADSLRKLLHIVGPAYQSRPTDALLAEAKDISVRLRAWHQVYGPMESHASHSPATVLAQFTGKSPEDALTENHVGETQARIDEQLSLGETARESVIDTLNWLREASEAATESKLEISAIVDHLHIA